MAQQAPDAQAARRLLKSTIRVIDLDASVQWYTKNFGVKLLSQDGVSVHETQFHRLASDACYTTWPHHWAKASSTPGCGSIHGHMTAQVHFRRHSSDSQRMYVGLTAAQCDQVHVRSLNPPSSTLHPLSRLSSGCALLAVQSTAGLWAFSRGVLHPGAARTGPWVRTHRPWRGLWPLWFSSGGRL